MKKIVPVFVVVLFAAAAVFVLFGIKPPPPLQAVRNQKWAQPVVLEGVPNLHRIDEWVCRSAQPTPAGFKNIEKLGIKTVINLRGFHSDKDDLDGAALNVEEISFKTWHPETEDVVRFIDIVKDRSRGPFLVHCQHGADRTGMMSAIYRMYFHNWGNQEAIEEMINGGFGYHPMWKDIKKYLEELDIGRIKNKTAP